MKLLFAIILILLAFELGALCAMKIQLDKIKIDLDKIKKWLNIKDNKATKYVDDVNKRCW